MKTDISNKNICFDLNRTSITSPLSQISISITEKIQNVILKTSNQLKAGNIKEVENILQAHYFIKKFVINSNEVITACKDGLVKCLSNGWTKDAEEIVSFMKEQGINEEEIIKKSEIIKVLMQKLNCKSIEDLFEYDCEFLSYVMKNNINEFSFSDNIIGDNLIKKYGLYAIYKLSLIHI